MNHRYATLDQVKAELRTVDEFQDSDDNAEDYLSRALYFVSERIAKETNHTFWPEYHTEYYDAEGSHIIDGLVLQLTKSPFLSITTVVDGMGNTLVQGTDWEAYPKSIPPIRQIQLLMPYNRLWGWNRYTLNPRDAITVTGITGYNETPYADCWYSSSDTVQTTISASDTQLSVLDVDDIDSLGLKPRFSVGQLIRIGTEFCEVIRVNPSTNVLDLRRGINGSTAASHTSGATIDIFQPQPDIQRAAIRWVSYLYKRRGAFDQTSYKGLAATAFPVDIPPEVADILDLYRNEWWSATGD